MSDSFVAMKSALLKPSGGWPVCRTARAIARKRDGTRPCPHGRSAEPFPAQPHDTHLHENRVVSAERWNVKGMLAHPMLARRIADVGWGDLLRQFEYKAQWYGRTFIRIDRFYPSSNRCHACSHAVDHFQLARRRWICSACGAVLDRERNAARNIKKAGLAERAARLAVSSCGGGARPTGKRVSGP